MTPARVTIEADHWLAPGPAASWARMERAGKPSGGITEAGRTTERQAELYRQYLRGELMAYAARPGTSKHETGRAVDMQTASSAHAWLIAHGRAHGWTRPLLRAAKPEPWHWEYSITLDEHFTDGATAPDPIIPTEEDDLFTDDDRRRAAETLALLKEQQVRNAGKRADVTVPEAVAEAVWQHVAVPGGAYTQPASMLRLLGDIGTHARAAASASAGAAPGQTDAAAVAEAVVAALGADLARQVADELAARLSSPRTVTP